MDNKLSELSKPVATVDVQRGRPDGNMFGVAWSSAGHALPDGPHFIYSQEYVSTLIQRAERIDSMLTESVQALKAAEQRIAELEAIRADASQVFKEIGNELGCNPDNESIMMAIDALKERERRVVALAGGNAELWETMAARLEAAEAKLATPVRLPDIRSDDYHETGWFQHMKYYRDVERSIRAAGFAVGGE